MSEESLKDKTVKGTAWSAIDNIAQYAVSYVVGIVLARLIIPKSVKGWCLIRPYRERYVI